MDKVFGTSTLPEITIADKNITDANSDSASVLFEDVFDKAVDASKQQTAPAEIETFLARLSSAVDSSQLSETSVDQIRAVAQELFGYGPMLAALKTL